MKFLEKEVTLGEMKFRVRTNRDIAVSAFEQCPEAIEYVLNKMGNEEKTETQYFIDALKNKELGTLFSMNEKVAELVKYALPLMLQGAGDETNAEEIIKYAKENDADDMFNSKMLEFLMQGFTPRGQEEPKIQFSMK